MIRLLFISDFTEQFSYKLLKGIMDFSNETEPWIVWKMSTSTKRTLGMKGVVSWAKKWKADVVIGQFEPEDDLSMFTRQGIVVFAQDNKQKIHGFPNITADYIKTGRMAAEYDNGKASVTEFNESKNRYLSSLSTLLQSEYEYLYNSQILRFYRGESLTF